MAWLQTVLQDFRYGIRLLRKQPTHSTVAILTLALGIGGTTALFSVIDEAILRPLPYPNPQQLVWVMTDAKTGDGAVSRGWLRLSSAEIQNWTEARRIFSHVAVSSGASSLVIDDGPEPEQLGIFDFQLVSPEYFDMLGVTPARGRPFQYADTVKGAPKVVIVGDGYWSRRYGRDPNVVGRTIRLAEGPATVVGVVPSEFSPKVQIWLPLSGEENGVVEARLKPGVRFREAAQLRMALPPLLTTTGYGYIGPVTVDSAIEYERTGGYSSSSLTTLAGAVGLILLMVCVNVAGLVLARGATRRPELAVRASLGAGRARLIRQLFTESLVLAIVGGIAGILLASVSLSFLVANLAGFSNARINVGVLAASLSFTVVTGVVIGLMPALRLSRIRDRSALASRMAHAPLRRRGGQLLIAAEVTLAIVLLACAGGVIREVARRLSADLGVELDRLLVMEVTPLDKATRSLSAYYPALLEALRARPDIEAAGASQSFPLVGTVWGQAVGSRPGSLRVRIRRVLPGYLEALGLPLRQGRLPVDADRAGVPTVAISDEAARLLFPDGSAAGRKVTMRGRDYLVAGVVANTVLEGRGEGFAPGMAAGRDDGTAPQIYEVFGPTVPLPLTVVVRARGSEPGIQERLRDVVRKLGPRAAVNRIVTGAEIVWLSGIEGRARTAKLLGLFSGLGLLLALIGVFGVTTYAVTRRTPEIGVRLALGATPARVVRSVVRDSAVPALVGVAAGLATTMILARIVPSFMYVEFLSGDLATRTTVAVLLGTMAGVAAWIPARRAGRVDPVTALRAD